MRTFRQSRSANFDLNKTKTANIKDLTPSACPTAKKKISDAKGSTLPCAEIFSYLIPQMDIYTRQTDLSCARFPPFPTVS